MTVLPYLTLLGSSALMRSVRDLLGRLAQSPWPVRIEGPTGTGKTVAARLLHNLSARANGAFVVCSLNMVAEALAQSDLVGYVKGAFTGAVMDHIGAFEAAHAGTLFLDEIGTAIAVVQLALLTLLESGQVRRMGEQRSRLVDVRLVFATNTKLEDEVRAGRFRRDLFYRLGELKVEMRALKDHPEDIPEIAEHALAEYSSQHRVAPPPLNSQELSALQAYDWPGNVRELQSTLKYFVALGELPGTLRGGSRDPHWRTRLNETLVRCNGVKADTARELGVSRKTLHEELRRRAGNPVSRAS